LSEIQKVSPQLLRDRRSPGDRIRNEVFMGILILAKDWIEPGALSLLPHPGTPVGGVN
jgi:hypothetical protein